MYTHFHTYSYNQSVLKIRVQEMDLVSKRNESDINQLKAKLDNVQSGNLSISRGPTVEYSKESFDLLSEKIREKEKWRRKKESKRGGRRVKMKGGVGWGFKKREKGKNRKTKINRCMWKEIIYIQE